ncbi:response regulator transcription factor, partial [Enterococcus faecium]
AKEALGRSLRVLIVDDEDIYRQALAASFARTLDLTNAVVLRMAANSDQAVELAQKAGYDLVITDVDMGPASLNGFDLVARLRTMPTASAAQAL